MHRRRAILSKCASSHVIRLGTCQHSLASFAPVVPTVVLDRCFSMPWNDIESETVVDADFGLCTGHLSISGIVLNLHYVPTSRRQEAEAIPKQTILKLESCFEQAASCS
jgi:hypothetical protein